MGGADTNARPMGFHWKQLFYVANFIDYARVLFLYMAIASYPLPSPLSAHVPDTDANRFAVWYVLSYFLDAFDGMAARAFDQCSDLGYYLDMIIDRASGIAALYRAAQMYTGPATLGLYLALLLVEVLAHGVIVYQADVKGVHQKSMGQDFWIVRAYLDSKAALFWACASFELFTVSLILQWPLLGYLCFPGFIFRAVANVVRLYACLGFDKPGGPQHWEGACAAVWLVGIAWLVAGAQ